MQANRRSLAVAIVFLVLVAGTRFYHIGWSIGGDEPTMLAQVRSVVEKPFFLRQFGPLDAEGRAYPVPHLLNAVAFRVFGTDEVGSRMGCAIAGVLGITITVLVVSRLYGLTNAVVLGMMLLLWDWHIYHSQSNRHYSYAFLFATTALLTATLGWQRNSFWWALLAGVFSALAISSHLFTAVVPAGFLLFFLVEAAARRGPVQKRALWGYVVSGVPLMIISCGLGLWAFGSWLSPSQGRLDYSVSHSLMGLSYNLGLGVVVLSMTAWLLAWRKGDASERMWAAVAAVVSVVTVVVPRFLVFRPDYVFPATVVFFLLASRTLTRAFEDLKSQSRVLAYGLVVAFFAVPLPSFLSYYQDGDRHDYRAAAALIKEHLCPGDVIAADTPMALEYYLNVPVTGVVRPVADPQACIEALQKLSASGNRVWYVCRYTRDEPAPDADRWLWEHAVRMRRFKQKRFDYHENALDVYLFGSGGSGAKGRDT